MRKLIAGALVAMSLFSLTITVTSHNYDDNECAFMKYTRQPCIH
ncbi:hypothetical protein [Baia soyae]|uniref:Uncharacterized protein n=1 Tax=Baia soyae TaxID=1544746 RepID=A0A4R2S1U7_9BACL|nr:hypothetical protein [Baia soyae]TCP69212.1 hypothetical protein EDD57_1118 [Baia soyae]